MTGLQIPHGHAVGSPEERLEMRFGGESAEVGDRTDRLLGIAQELHGLGQARFPDQRSEGGLALPAEEAFQCPPMEAERDGDVVDADRFRRVQANVFAGGGDRRMSQLVMCGGAPYESEWRVGEHDRLLFRIGELLRDELDEQVSGMFEIVGDAG